MHANSHSMVEDSFLRIDREEEEYSLFNFGLFVCMVVIAVLWIGSNPQSITVPSRALMELPEVKDNSSEHKNSSNITGTEGIVATAIMPA